MHSSVTWTVTADRRIHPSCRRTLTVRWTSISVRRRLKGTRRIGCRRTQAGDGKRCCVSTRRRSRSSTKCGSCRTSRSLPSDDVSFDNGDFREFVIAVQDGRTRSVQPNPMFHPGVIGRQFGTWPLQPPNCTDTDPSTPFRAVTLLIEYASRLFLWKYPSAP